MKVNFAFGDPMFVQGNGSEEHEKVIEFISRKFEEWGKKNYIVSK